MVRKLLLLCCIVAGTTCPLFAQQKDYAPFQHRKADTIPPAGATRLLERIKQYADSTRRYLDQSSWKNAPTRPHYFIDGSPVFLGVQNEGSAQTISTDVARDSYGLTGANMTLMQWDGGKVRENHVLLLGNVDNYLTNNVAYSDHSTHVAGTMVSNGIFSGTKGMAPAAHLEAHRYTQGLEYLGELLTVSLAYPGGLISNHSYGESCGWVRDSSGLYYWAGNENHSSTEDSKFGLYSPVSSFIDNICFQAPKHLVVVAASNDRDNRNRNPGGQVYTMDANGALVPRNDIHPMPDYAAFMGYNTVVPISSTKNTLVVGAVEEIPGGFTSPSQLQCATFSNWGPTDDGRIKPDIVAKGVAVKSSVAFTEILGQPVASLTATKVENGTSMATPAVTGSALLLAEKFIDQTNQFPASSTLKGLIIHTADAKNPNGAPDYRFGWGLMNTKRAADFLQEMGTDKWLLERQLNNNMADTFTFQADGVHDIIATLCWTDPAGTPVTAGFLNNRIPMLVNDLDMRVYRQQDLDYSNTTGFRPYVLNVLNPQLSAEQGDNTLDNVEKIYIRANQLVQGTYVLVVKHKGTLTNGSQGYSLLLSGVTAVIQERPVVEFKAIQHNYNEITWADFSTTETAYRIERKTEGENSWQVRGNVAANVLLFRDSAILASRKYYYRVVALDLNQVIACTNIASLLTPTAPRRPTNLTLTLTDPSPLNRTLQLQWRDNATNETGFEVSYSRDGYNFEILDTTAALAGVNGTGVFIHSGLPQNGTYFYRVKSFWNNFDSGYSAIKRYNLDLPSAALERVEYYFDTDPGFDAGYPVPGSSGSLAMVINEVIIPATLPDGIHEFYIRAKLVKAGVSYWSNIYKSSFLKLTAPQLLPKVTTIEYYIDADPGPGAGIQVDVSSITGSVFNVPVDLSAVSSGLHHLYLRAKDNRGMWSTIYTASFIRLEGTAGTGLITRLEYDIDNMSALGNGTSIAITPASAINQAVTVDLSTAAAGLHTLYLRAMDNAGKWSNIMSSNFISLDGTGGNLAIRQAEYYFDTDPGWDNGTLINFPANSPRVIQDFNAPLASLPDGIHTLYIRAKDQNGNRSMIFSKPFLKLTGAAGERKIVELLYTVDNGLLIGTGTAIVVTAAPTIDLVFTLPPLTNGKHFLSIRTKDNSGLTGTLYADSFFVNDQQFCQLGSNVYYKSEINNAATYQWQEWDGTSWTNLVNTAYFSGVQEQTLRIAVPPTSWYGARFRCLANGIPGNEFILKFSNTWTGAVNTDWFTTGNWSCGVVPDAYTDVVIPQDVTRFPSVQGTGTCRSLYMRAGSQLTVEAGYLLQITGQ